MITANQRYNYLCSNLKKMGYEGNLEDADEIKKFLSRNTSHKLFPKAIAHWNELINMKYSYKRGVDILTNIRGESSLYGGRKV